MKLQIIKIGNSKGIRIPSSMLKQCEITDFVDVEMVDKSILIKASTDNKITLTYHKIKNMSDRDIQLMLKSTDLNSLAMSLSGLHNESQNRVYSNMSKDAQLKVQALVTLYEKMSPVELLEILSLSSSEKL